LARLGAPCKELQRALAKRCEASPEELLGLSAADLSKLLFGLGGAPGTKKACAAAALRLGARLEELDGPRAFVQAIEALARARTATVLGQNVAEDLARKLAPRVVDFSVKDVAAVASACQRLLLSEPSSLEALARQGLRKGWRFRPRYASTVLNACAAAGFRHPVVEELRASVVRNEEEAAARRASGGGGRRREEGEEGEEDSSMEASSSSSRPPKVGGEGGEAAAVAEDDDPRDEHERELERLLEADDMPIFDTFIPPKRAGTPGPGAGGHRPVRAMPGYSGPGGEAWAASPSSSSSPRRQHAEGASTAAGSRAAEEEEVEEEPRRRTREEDSWEEEPRRRWAKPLEAGKEDPDLRKYLRDVERRVLEPAGMFSQALATNRRSGQAGPATARRGRNR